jgi:teichoic acid transport system permease protein
MNIDRSSTAHLRPVLTTLSARGYLRALWGRREFAMAMPAEELRAQHQNTFLGNVWHLGNPLLTVAVYFVVFGGLLGVDRGIDNYLMWLTIGVFAYRFTSSSILGGATSITSNLGLMRSLQFPRALLPISVVIRNVLSFAFELSVLAAIAVLTGAGVSVRWFALPLVVAVQLMLNLGGAFIAARLTESFRDMQQLIPFVFRLLQYVSGVMYPIEQYLDSSHTWLTTFVAWNPMVRLLDMYRWVFLGLPVDLTGLVRTMLLCGVVLVVGFRFFVAAEHRYGRP